MTIVRGTMEDEEMNWSWEQDKAFENALADYPEETDDRWEKIAAVVPGKTAEEIEEHYELLMEDINAIEAGLVPLPIYASTSSGSADHGGGSGSGGVGGGKKGGSSHGESSHGGKASRMEQERRKGIAWTEEEHKQFLLGLEKYGKGDWRSISRNFVISRTPTQVASHAQKYFIRLTAVNKDRRRTSIHDITTLGAGDMAAPHGPITGQANSPIITKTGKHPSQPMPGVGMYGTTIGQPVGGPLMSAVGTPVHLPMPGAPNMAYGMRAPIPGTMVPGAPVHLPPMAYPMPPRTSSAQR